MEELYEKIRATETPEVAERKIAMLKDIEAREKGEAAPVSVAERKITVIGDAICEACE